MAQKGVARGQGARAGRRGGPAGRGGRAARAKPKTAEELDAEMAEYWDGSAPAPAGGAVAPQYAGAGAQADTMDEDGIMVGTPQFLRFAPGMVENPLPACAEAFSTSKI